MHWKIVLAILSCNILFMSASYTMIIPFLPLYLKLELHTPAEYLNLWSGAVFAASFLIAAIMAPIWGRLADRKGKRLMALRASFLLAISYFLGGIVTTPAELFFMRAFQGFAAGLWPMELAIMSLYAPTEKLGFCLGTMQGILTAGGVVGPLLGGALAEAFGMRSSFFVAAAALFANFLIFLFFIKEPPIAEAKEESPPLKTLEILSLPHVKTFLTASAFVQMVVLIMQPILTTYIATLTESLSNIVFISGLVFSLGGFAGAISAPFWGNLGQKISFYKTLCIGMVGAGISMLFQGIPSGLYIFAALQFTGGLFFSAIHPSLNAITVKATPSSVKGQIFGMLFAAQQVGSVIGPILGGITATYLGMHSVFHLAGFLLLLLAGYMGRKYLRVAAP